MRAWVLILGVFLLDVVFLVAWFGTGLAENCDAGRSGWTCNEFIGDAAPFAFVFGSAALIGLVIVALGRGRGR